MTREKSHSITNIPVYLEERGHLFLMKTAGIQKDFLKYRIVVTFDPKWGSPGYKANGLFPAMLKCLKAIQN